MKVLKIIGIILLVLILIVVVLALVAPKSYEVSRSIVINADKDFVFHHMKHWRYFVSWSPWAQQDSTIKTTITGVDGQVDSKYMWEGDPEITGSGEMTNTGLIPNEEMTYHLYFKEPWESHADGWFRVEEAENGTKASWGFYGDYPIPLNIMLLFMPMDKMIGPDFERGLESLKQFVEARAEKKAQLEVQNIRYNSSTFAAIRQEVRLDEMTAFFESSFAAINTAMQNAGAMMTGPPSAIFYSWDEEQGLSDMAAAIPTRSTVQDGDIQMITVPTSDALAIDFYGPYDDIELAHLAMMDYFQNNDVTAGDIVLEEYLTDPQSMSDPNKWLTRVVYLLQ